MQPAAWPSNPPLKTSADGLRWTTLASAADVPYRYRGPDCWGDQASYLGRAAYADTTPTHVDHSYMPVPKPCQEQSRRQDIAVDKCKNT